jgi:hypothetical protein
MKTYIKLFILVFLCSCASRKEIEEKNTESIANHETFRLDIGGAHVK